MSKNEFEEGPLEEGREEESLDESRDEQTSYEKKMSEENGQGQSNKTIYLLVAAVLVVGFVFGSLFGGMFNVAGWFGDEEPDPGEMAQIEDMEGENGFEAAKPQLEQQLRQEKEQEIIMQHLDDLEAASQVERYLDVFGEGDEDAVIATVNGEEIKKKELLEEEEQQKQQMMMMGMDPDSEESAQMLEQVRPQILDSLVLTEVLMQKIEEEGIAVTDEDVEAQYQEYVEEFQGEEMLEQQLEQAGMTKEELKQEIKEQLPLQIYIDNYVEENLDESDLDFSEEELREMYEMQQQQMPQQPPMEVE